jgi:hypothetical protein
MNHDQIGSEIGLQIISPFKNSGRLRSLMDDAEHYKTMRNEEKFSNLGPGSYNVSISWQPDSFIKYDRNRIMTRSKSRSSTVDLSSISSASKTRFRTQYEKSWIQTINKPTLVDSSILSTKFNKKNASNNINK